VDPPLGLGAGADPPLGPLPQPRPAELPVEWPVARPGASHVEPPVVPEVVRATGRTTDEVLALVGEARRAHPHLPAVVLRAAPEALVALAAEHPACTTMDSAAMAAAVGPLAEPAGRVAVMGDGPVAAEVAFVARVTGAEVVTGGVTASDVDCVVVVPGSDAALPARIAAGTGVPVVVVPTSSEPAGGFAGLGGLLTMLSTPTPGVVISALDDGWSAGVFAARMARRTRR
jgi:NCAIR mutase (PurE)-related protein